MSGPLLDRKSHPSPEQVQPMLQQLQQRSSAAATGPARQSVLAPFIEQRRAIDYDPGLVMMQCYVDAHLNPLFHVDIHHARSYDLPPKPPSRVPKASAANSWKNISTYEDLKSTIVARDLFDYTSFVVAPIHQVMGGPGPLRGLNLSALNNKTVLTLDAATMGPELFKAHHAFGQLDETAVVWSPMDLMALKSAYNIRFRQVLVLQFLLFPNAPTDQKIDLEDAAQILLGPDKMAEWAASVAATADQDLFLAVSKLQWLWILGRNFLQFMPQTLVQQALDRSKVTNNQRAGLGPNLDYFPAEVISECFENFEDVDLSDTMKIWRALEALYLGTSWESLFKDAAITAMVDETLPITGDWVQQFYDNHLALLAPHQVYEFRDCIGDIGPLFRKVDQLLYTTKTETLLSISRSAGLLDENTLEDIRLNWCLAKSDLPGRMTAIEETYRLGHRFIDCGGGYTHHPAMRMKFSVFHRSMLDIELRKLLHRWCVPQDLTRNRPIDAALLPDRDLKASGSFNVCCKFHIFLEEATIINLPHGGLLVLIRDGELDED